MNESEKLLAEIERSTTLSSMMLVVPVRKMHVFESDADMLHLGSSSAEKYFEMSSAGFGNFRRDARSRVRVRV